MDNSIDTHNANIVKKCFIDAMLEEGIITEETYVEMEQYAIICSQPEVLGSYIDSLHESKKSQFFIVKMIDIPKQTEENDIFLASQKELNERIKALEEENLRLKGEIIRISHIEPEVQTFYTGATAENPTPEVSTTSKFAKKKKFVI